MHSVCVLKPRYYEPMAPIMVDNRLIIDLVAIEMSSLNISPYKGTFPAEEAQQDDQPRRTD